MTNIHYQTLTEVAADIAAGRRSSREVTEALLARIAALEPRLHAYYTVLEAEALAQADWCDAQQAAGASLGQLHGVPLAVKDLCHKVGTPTTAGHSFRRQAISTEDATVVARLEAAGAVILGKLATTEGAMTGYHPDFQIPRNPWGEHDCWPGVSSGGSGVATAAGLCFGALGTDTGGSIRWPSAANGIVGLKPTWGRVSRHNVLDLAPTLDHIGPMTRSVRDAARMLGVLAGEDPADPTTLQAPVPDYEGGLDGRADGLRIGWDEDYATEGVEPYLVYALREAIAQLEYLGAEIVPLTVPRLTDEEAGIWFNLASAEAAVVHADTYPAQADAYGELFGQFLAMGHAVTGVEHAKAEILRRNAVGRMAGAFTNIDLLLLPTTSSETFRYTPTDAYTGVDPHTGSFSGFPFEWSVRNQRFIALWNLNGYPTLSVPAGLSPNRLPISLQFVGKPLGEPELLRAGFAYEQANGFKDLHPLD